MFYIDREELNYVCREALRYRDLGNLNDDGYVTLYMSEEYGFGFFITDYEPSGHCIMFYVGRYDTAQNVWAQLSEFCRISRNPWDSLDSGVCEIWR
jgi:hypothetical protein